MSDADIDTLLIVGFVVLIFLFVYLGIKIGFWWTTLSYFIAFALVIYVANKGR